jgi:adenine-specific DNA-methyltransferase
MNELPERESTETTAPFIKSQEALRNLFPGVIQDGALDVPMLTELLNVDAVGMKDGKERFGLMWAGKKLAVEALQAPSLAALKPDLENSVNWESAQNVFIEGDNLEILKLLQSAYNDQIKLIYIDPPYNTGNDFVYNDDFTDPLKHYLQVTGQVDGEGNRLVANTDTSGRKHSNWLSMMYPRLVLARNLLTQDGSIFVSIDDNEIHNLMLLLNLIFGEDNHVGTVAVKMSHLSGVKMSHATLKLPKIKEWLIIFARDKSKFKLNPVFEKCTWDETLDRYTSWLDYESLEDIQTWSRKPLSEKLKDVENKDEFCIQNANRIFRTAVNDALSGTPKDGVFRRHLTGTGIERISYNGGEVIFASSKIQTIDGVATPVRAIGDMWTDIGINNLHNEGGVDFQNGKKPLKLISRILDLATAHNDTVLDFFGGSGTTAEAVLRENRRQNIQRRFVLINLPEDLEQGSKQWILGDRTVCDISRRRIGNALEESPLEGVRCFRLGASGFRNQETSEHGEFQLFELSKQPTSKAFDVALQIALANGLKLSDPFKTLEVQELKFTLSADTALIFEGQVTFEAVKEIVETQNVRNLLFVEDLFAGHDDLKSNIFFFARNLNITMRTY